MQDEQPISTPLSIALLTHRNAHYAFLRNNRVTAAMITISSPTGTPSESIPMNRRRGEVKYHELHGHFAALLLCLALVAACGEASPPFGKQSPKGKTSVTDDAIPKQQSPSVAPSPVAQEPEQEAHESPFIGPLNYRQEFLPEVLRVFQKILDEDLDESISVDVLNDVDFADGSKYATTGVYAGPAFVLLGDDQAVHIYLRSGSYLRLANALGIELGHAVQRRRLGNEAYEALRRDYPHVVSARAKAIQRALLIGIQESGALSAGLTAPKDPLWLTRLDAFLDQEVDNLADSEPFAISFFLVWKAAFSAPDPNVSAELRESGQLSFDSASALARKLLDADLTYFDELRSRISADQAAEIRSLLLTRFVEDVESYPSYDLISGFLLP